MRFLKKSVVCLSFKLLVPQREVRPAARIKGCRILNPYINR